MLTRKRIYSRKISNKLFSLPRVQQHNTQIEQEEYGEGEGEDGKRTKRQTRRTTKKGGGETKEKTRASLFSRVTCLVILAGRTPAKESNASCSGLHWPRRLTLPPLPWRTRTRESLLWTSTRLTSLEIKVPGDPRWHLDTGGGGWRVLICREKSKGGNWISRKFGSREATRLLRDQRYYYSTQNVTSICRRVYFISFILPEIRGSRGNCRVEFRTITE